MNLRERAERLLETLVGLDGYRPDHPWLPFIHDALREVVEDIVEKAATTWDFEAVQWDTLAEGK